MNSYSGNCNCNENPRPRGPMPVNMPSSSCGCRDYKPGMPESRPCPRPERQSLAIASVKWQTWKNVMDGGSGLAHGSIFEDLVLPFIGSKAACAQCSQPSYQGYIQEVSFAIDDVVLYLDTHPYDEEALKYYKKYKKLYHEASEEYTQCYGPLQTSNVIADDRWTWVEGPWPWEGGC